MGDPFPLPAKVTDCLFWGNGLRSFGLAGSVTGQNFVFVLPKSWFKVQEDVMLTSVSE